MAKEYLDKEGLKRLVELLKGEIGKAGGGGSGSSIHYTSMSWGQASDGSYSSVCQFDVNHLCCKPNVSDLVVTYNGVMGIVTSVTEIGALVICNCSYCTTLKGTDGKSILYCSNKWIYNSDGIPCLFMTSDFSETPKEGDCGITSDGILFKVNRITTNVCHCVYLATLKGTDGKDGVDGTNGYSILYYNSNWGTSGGVPMNSMGLNEIYFSYGPKDGDLAISKDGVLFRIAEYTGGYVGYYITPLKGSDGRSIFSMKGGWSYNNDIPSQYYYYTASLCDYYTPKAGDLGITQEGVLFRVNGWLDETNEFELEYIMTLKDQPDLSEYMKKADIGAGLYMSSQGKAIVMKAERNDIAAKINAYNPIVPSIQDYAWKMSAIDNKEEWTDEEKAAARKTLGIDTVVGDINTVLESILGV